jgi:hypothetical protein
LEGEGDGEVVVVVAVESALRLEGERDAGMGDGVGDAAVVDGAVERRGLRRGPVAPALNMKLSSFSRPWKVGARWVVSSAASGAIVSLGEPPQQK